MLFLHLLYLNRFFNWKCFILRFNVKTFCADHAGECHANDKLSANDVLFLMLPSVKSWLGHVKHACSSKQWHSQIRPAHNWVISCCSYWFYVSQRTNASERDSHVPLAHACMNISWNIYHFFPLFTQTSEIKMRLDSFLCILINFHIFFLSLHVSVILFDRFRWRTIDKLRSQLHASATEKDRVQVKFSISTR